MHIAVYCGASLGTDPAYKEAAKRVGKWIAEKKHTLVYGGGKAGLMGAVADEVLANKGEAIGVIRLLSGKRAKSSQVNDIRNC